MIDYRVDMSKMIWGPPRPNGPDGTIQLPARCPAQNPKGPMRDSLLTRLVCFLFEDQKSYVSRPYEYRIANQCNDYLGHWEYPERRMHVDGFQREWPVTAADTTPLNPTETPK